MALRSRQMIPLEWLAPVCVAKIATWCRWSPMRALEPPKVEHHRVAPITERAHLSAAPPWIKRVVAPLNFSRCAHAHLQSPLRALEHKKVVHTAIYVNGNSEEDRKSDISGAG